MSWYCDIAPGHPFHGPYHEHEYGFPLADDNALFERLALEINQAGLSWLIVLKRRDGLQRAFDGFDVDKVAGYGAWEKRRLLADAGIIRNRLKVEAVIENAKRIAGLRDRFGSFASWIEAQHPLAKDDWVRLFRQTFVFTGGEVTGEFLMSIGYLPNAHRPDCPVFARVARLKPAWMRAQPAAPSAPAQKKKKSDGNKSKRRGKAKTRRIK